MLNPRFPAPVNTYNPTVHALVDAIFAALGPIVPGKVRADGSGSRSIILGGRSTYTGKGYVQYEIIAGGAGARATKDGASGITVNQSNAKIAPIEIIESEFPTRVLRFELIRDSGGAGQFRGGLGIRREYLNLADARFSIRSMKHVIPPNGCAGGAHRPHRRHLDQSRHATTPSACRPATPIIRCKAGDMFRLDTPGGGGYGDPLARAARARARRRARRLCVAGGGGARLWRGADRGSAARWTTAATAQKRACSRRRSIQ